MHLDFHIFDILDFDLLIGYPLENLLTLDQGSLDELLRETTFAPATSCLNNYMVKYSPEQNLLEEMTHTSPFVSSEMVRFEVAKLATSKEYGSKDTLHFCEDEQLSSPSIKFEPLPTGPEYVLDHDRESTPISLDESLEMENQWAMKICEAPTLETEEKDSTNEHGSSTLEIPRNP